MQTFLPYPDFQASAVTLDRQRLGKQRVECVQLLQVLTGRRTFQTPLGWTSAPFSPKGWVNHPAAKMWKGYVGCLAEYGTAVCDEWIRRGYVDTCRERIALLATFTEKLGKFEVPGWLGTAEFHASHRSNLLRKNPTWYSQFGWTEPPDLPYVWPI